MKLGIFLLAAFLLLCNTVLANDSFPPPSDPLTFVQGKWPQIRTGKGVLEVVGNKIIVSEPADFDYFGKAEKGAVVFVIEGFRIDPSDSNARGFTMRVTGTKYRLGYGGRMDVTKEKWLSFGGLRAEGKYRYRFIGGDRDFKSPVTSGASGTPSKNTNAASRAEKVPGEAQESRRAEEEKDIKQREAANRERTRQAEADSQLAVAEQKKKDRVAATRERQEAVAQARKPLPPCNAGVNRTCGTSTVSPNQQSNCEMKRVTKPSFHWDKKREIAERYVESEAKKLCYSTGGGYSIKGLACEQGEGVWKCNASISCDLPSKVCKYVPTGASSQ